MSELTRQPATAIALMERDEELAVLGTLSKAARAGEGALAVIEGTAGIGKTRLLGEVRARGCADMRVLSARGGEFEVDFAFGVVRQLFEPLLAAASPEARAELLAGAATLAEPLFDPANVAQQHAETDASFAMLHGLYWLAANVAYDRPTVLAIDDLHWADTPSLRWLCYLARRLEGLPLLVAIAMRPPEQGRDPELLTELLSDPAAAQIQPGPLTVPSIAMLVRRRFPNDEPDAGFCAAVEAATRGNPLFVLALVDTVATEGIHPHADQAHVLLELGPLSVGRAVSNRLTRLQPAATALIEAACILGDGTALRHAIALAGIGETEGARAAQQLVQSDLLRNDDPVEFFHPVVRTAIYEQLDSLAKSTAHRRAAEILLDAGSLPEQAAAHLLLTSGDDEFVVSTMRAAATRSLAQGAPDAAVSYLTRALASAAGSERGEVLVDLGLAERLIDPNGAIDHLFAGLELITDQPRRTLLALELAASLFYVNRIPEAIGLLERALEEIEATDNHDLAERVEAELIACAWWDEEHWPIAEGRVNAIDVSTLQGGLGSDLLLADIAFYLCRRARDRETALDAARRALAPSRLTEAGALGFHLAAFALFSAGAHDEAIAAYDAALAACRRRGDTVRGPAILAFRGRALTLKGDLEGALADLNDTLIAQSSEAAVPYAIGFYASALMDGGRFEEASAVIERAGLPDELPINGHLFFFMLARGRYNVMTGNHERGVAELLELGRRIELIPFDNPSDYSWRRYAVEGLLQLGRKDEAVRLATEDIDVAKRWGAPAAIAAALRTLGVALGGEEGEALLREAVEVAAGSGALIQHARALVELGAALRRGNKRAEARDRLKTGAELAYRAGAAALVQRANDELAATGARPRKNPVGGIFSLTASERRVAELAAQDYSNKEIAQALFVTVKTVEVHLSSVYRKLQITSRRQVAAALGAAEPAVAANP